MICWRSESLSTDRDRHRLQVLNGDPTRSQLSTFVRFALTSLVIAAIEEGLIRAVPEMKDPVATARILSEAWEKRPPVALADGRSIDAVDMLREHYLGPLKKRASLQRAEAETGYGLRLFEESLDLLERNDLGGLSRKAEWAIKIDLFERHFGDYFDPADDAGIPRETANNAYCAVTDTLFDELERELGLPRLVSEAEIDQSLLSPPPLSRGKARADIARSLNGQIDELNWDWVVVHGEKFRLPEDVEWTPERISGMIREIEAKG
jgi:proteasome accessory factor A